MPPSDSHDKPKARLHLRTGSVRIDRRKRGQLLQGKVALVDHALLSDRPAGFDPVEVLDQFNATRMQELVPLRWGRMLNSPFAFFRGSAALMSADLAKTPRTDVMVQACGDCHLLNFGAYATPERNIVFDINDFDETLPAPWEWDVKRLATSFALAARGNGLADSCAEGAAAAVARSYRQNTEKYSHMDLMDVWYSRIDWQSVVEKTSDPRLAQTRQDRLKTAVQRTARDYYFPKFTEEKGGRILFKEQPPLLYHPVDQMFCNLFFHAIPAYRDSLPDNTRRLFDRYELADVAMKVVGIGSVGTMCGVALLMGPDGEPLLLQIKEANASVLEQYIGKSEFENHGQRVVAGQKIAQSASDIFLGWTRFENGKHFYIRQLRDTKVKPEVDIWDANHMLEAAELMGAVLARAHARSGDSALIAGYLDDGDEFDRAIGQFAIAYADRTEQDYAALHDAFRRGKFKAQIEEDSD
jgi:uncharacterized protein (DUF2252 family)